MYRRSAMTLAALAGLAAGCGALAQDSVATTPGRSDAISSAHPDLQRTRYILDMAPVVSAWGTPFFVGPVLKASRSVDPLFSTQALGASAISPGQRTGVVISATPFSSWNAPGLGVNTDENGAPLTINSTGFGRAFGVAFSDFGLEPGDLTMPSSIVGAIVGQDANNLARLFVERTTAIVSRLEPTSPDSSTLSLGAIDEGGNVYLRADDFGATLGFANVKGENAISVSLSDRSVVPGAATSINLLVNLSGSPTGANGTLAAGGATRFLINNSTVTLNTPVGVFAPLAPGVLASSSSTIALDFRGHLTIGREATGASVSTSAHRAPGLAGLRGNPSRSIGAALGASADMGVVAMLAVPTGSTRANAINAFGLRSPAAPGALPTVAPGSAVLATLPESITGPDSFVANTTGNAEFTHYLSQISFRGPSGQAGVGQTATGELVLAGVATDPGASAALAREFLAVATRTGSSFVWTVAAHPGMAVFDRPRAEPGATRLGALASQSPASISSPGVDLLGNVYFVGAWDDERPASSGEPGTTGPGRKTGLFRAVRDQGGQYSLELLLTTGQRVTGVNSQTPYTIARLTLADADSVASGGFHAGQVLQSQVPGRETTNPRSGFASGGLIVNALLRYERTAPAPGGTIEPYEAVLFVGPRIALPGDANGDGVVNFADLNIVLSGFGQSGPPGSLPGDLNNDGVVNFADLNMVLSAFGQSTP